MKIRRPSKAAQSWSLSKKVSPVLGEIMLDLLHQAYGGKGRATEISSENGILLEEVRNRLPPRRPQWKRARLPAVDLAGNNALSKSRSIGQNWMILPPYWPEPRTRRFCVRIQPGMGFGSGDHETTSLCLKAMEAVLGKTKSFLDVGTGSGILAVAASKWGIPRITAIESDPKALRSARESARLNPESRRIRWKLADLARWEAAEDFEVIVANLLSGLLVSHAPRLVSWLAPGGALILSGFLRKERKEVETAFRNQGLLVRPCPWRGRRFGCAIFRRTKDSRSNRRH